MTWRRWAGKIEDFVDFQKDFVRYIVPNQFKIRVVDQVNQIRLLTGEKVVEANDIVPVRDESLTEMGAEKSSSPSYQDAFDLRHELISCFSSKEQVKRPVVLRRCPLEGFPWSGEQDTFTF